MSISSQTAHQHPGVARLTLVALAGATLLASLGISIVSVALPTVAAAFSVPVSGVQWVVVGYLLSVTVTIVTAGRLGDIHGHRRVLIAGLAFFTGASVLCAAAPTLQVLVAGRIAQGIGGAVLMALPLSLARDVAAKDRLGSAMGLLGTTSAMGTALGPALGGMMLAGFGWRSAFLLLAALGSLVLALVLSTTPAPPVRKRIVSMDWPGMMLLALGLTAYALTATSGRVASTLPISFLLPAAGAALALFIVAEVRSAAPLVPVSVMLDRTVASSFAANLLVTTIMMSTLVVGPFFLSHALHLDVAIVGLVMAVGPATAALAGYPAGRLTDRFGAPRVLAAGIVVIIAGLICLGSLPRLLGAPGYVLALVVLTPGFQLFLAANNTTVMISAPESQRGVLSGLLGLSRNLGFMTGASVVTTLFVALAGSEKLTSVPQQTVAMAFTATFFASAGLAVLALLLTLAGRHPSPD